MAAMIAAAWRLGYQLTLVQLTGTKAQKGKKLRADPSEIGRG
jgi:hypothetical protein